MIIAASKTKYVFSFHDQQFQAGKIHFQWKWRQYHLNGTAQVVICLFVP
jgi:hypothetical protein